jgi:hypothetical protein
MLKFRRARTTGAVRLRARNQAKRHSRQSCRRRIPSLFARPESARRHLDKSEENTRRVHRRPPCIHDRSNLNGRDLADLSATNALIGYARVRSYEPIPETMQGRVSRFSKGSQLCQISAQNSMPNNSQSDSTLTNYPFPHVKHNLL